MADFRARIREDGTVEGHVVETYYHACERFYVDTDNGFIGIIADGGGYDIETRVSVESVAEAMAQVVSGLNAKVAELEAALQAERERLDWIAEHSDLNESMDLYVYRLRWYGEDEEEHHTEVETRDERVGLRAAIDAAMSGTHKADQEEEC